MAAWSGVNAVLLLCAPAMAETPAGTVITNTAMLGATTGGASVHAASNPVSLIVAERLDLVLTTGDGPIDGTTAAGGVAFALVNGGNGNERFALTGTAGGGAATFAIDVDGDGRFDPAHDIVLADGQTPALSPGGKLALLALLAPGAGATGDRLVVVARAATASGQPGTVAPGAGDGGGDAIVGPTGATARFDRPFTGAADAPTLTKTQAIAAPDGSARPVSGAIVTYTLEARFAAAAQTARVDDTVPAGTRYLPGSLRLDGTVLTDAADADAGQADDRAIAVTLGPVVAAAVRRITFQVTLP